MSAIKTTRKKHTLKSPYFCIENKTGPPLQVKNCLNMSICKGKDRLNFPFFNVPCVNLAKALLGKVMVRVLKDGTVLKGKIVETESYLGGEDRASLSFGGKITEKSKPMYMTPGTTFVYLTMGMYYLINISSQGDGSAVLIRALEPLQGIERMEKLRNEFNPKKTQVKKDFKAIPAHQLCNGPGKLCISLDIKKDTCNMQDLSTWDEMWIESGDDIPEDNIVKSSRIGIDSAGKEWANKLLRFYIINNKSVSKRNKLHEAMLEDKKSNFLLGVSNNS